VSWEEDEERFKPFDRRLFRRIFVFMHPYKWTFWGTVIVWVTWTVATLFQPDLLRRGIDKYIVPAIKGQVMPASSVRGLVVIGLIMVGIAISALALRIYRVRVGTRLGEWVANDIRRAIFKHVQELSMSYFDRTKQGWIIARADSDLDVVYDLLTWAVPEFAANLLTLAGAVTVMFLYNWRLALAVSFTIPPLFVITWLFRKKVGDAYRLVRQASSRITANIAENISGVRVVQSFVRQERNLERFDELNRNNLTVNVAAARIWESYWPSLGLVGAAGTTIIIWYGTYLVTKGQLTPGEVIAFMGYMGMFFGPISAMGRLYNILLASMAAAERIFKLLDTQPDVQDLPGSVELPRIHGEVVFDHVSFTYDKEPKADSNWVLRDVSFAARPGQTIALVGSTGAGKTTIVSLIPRFYDVQEGRILIDGQDVKGVTIHSLHSQMGIVLQDSFLFSGTVMQNIKYGRPEATNDEVFEAAKKLGCYDILSALPKGFDTEVGERGDNLSQGQRQLVSFARAVVADPRILILDEATSSVDVQTEKVLQYALEKLIERRTSFVVAHRLSTVRHADMVLVVEDGRITERGTHSELIEANGAYAEMYAQFIRA
jgi:ATP-binding cassette, subfamily B, multidrug efflux pump